MSILSTLFDKLRGHSSGSASSTAAPAAPAATTAPAPIANAPTASTPSTPTSTPVAQANTQQANAAPQAHALNDVDMEQVLEGLSAKSGQKLNWRTSIVDLMKLLGMESSLQERKQLADELGYTGDKNDSAAMNIWLHKKVLRTVADNGGKVPANLLD